ncbi:hypothetical protein [Streptomyces bohaiensis]|uniref:Uncharacterized protein n=1 Tax=Streptomyces bohaiensis TaxID=1431344 RepID=A0ABX1CKL1_9ACTN|nr:hypothetical protein [Streptomyces bohaiensis]NJQ17134.1 hypothetical protein [Streptomyces bohaiensis]
MSGTDVRAERSLPVAAVDCERCGAVPAVRADLRRLTAVVVLHRLTTSQQRLCRACGIQTFDHMTRRTLLLGWWSPLFPVNVLLIVLNFVSCLRYLRLAPPEGAPWGWLVRERRPGHRTAGLPYVSVAAGALCVSLVVAALAYAVHLNYVALTG